jgi:hypothetical protein
MNTTTHATSFPGSVRVRESRRRPLTRAIADRTAAVRNLGWDLGVVIMERISGHRRDGERLDVRLAVSVRDLVAQKSRAVRSEVGWLVQTVQSTGSYQAREEAARAMRAVMDALGEKVPPELLLRLCEHLPQSEADRLRAAAEERHGAESADQTAV